MPSPGREIESLSEVMIDPRYYAFISLFNRDQDYYECHEVMEELWLEAGRSPLLQGMLQAAVGLHHWDHGNLTGAVKLMTAAGDKLDRYGDLALGVDLEKLRLDLKHSLAVLAGQTKDTASFTPFLLSLCDSRLEQGVKDWEHSVEKGL